MTVFKALSITERKQKTPLTLLDFDEPELAEGEILIANVAVAQNPVDWKQLDTDFGIPTLPWTNGGDVAGTVYKTGPGVAAVAAGDRVIAFLSRKTARHGAYQTHSIADVTRSVKLPETYTFEEGSTFPLAYTTAAAGLASALGVALPAAGAPLPGAPRGEPLLVWGASSSVGAYAVQLAALAGYTVLATASAAHHDYVRALGAAHVFDYHDANVVADIRSAAGPGLALAYDAISYASTATLSVQSITAPAGRVAVILQVDPSISTPAVRIVQTGAADAFSTPAIGRAAYALLADALARRALRANPVTLVPGGLGGVFGGWERGRSGKVSGEKLVYRIADTKF